ncbi:MAG: methyltransferase domain-containing protein [Candidatus Tumulicola sp.]
MQSRPLKPQKSYPKHPELTISPPDPNTSIAHMLEMIGERKKVLDLGCASGYLASLLVKRECDVVGIDINPAAVEEARRFCTSAFVADLDEVVLPDLLEGKQFDAIVFGDVLEHLHEPARTLDESRALLTERGYVVASIPNISHGAIRLALLSGSFDYQELGILDDAHLRFFTGKTIDELFLTTGFIIEAIERVSLPLFAESDLVPTLDPRDFDSAALAEVRADPESETLQFVVKAFPLSNDQRLRAVSKRFLTANTELAATKQQITHRESELQSLRATLDSQEVAIASLRAEAERAGHGVVEAQEECRKLEIAHRLLEIDSLAKQNAAMQQTLVAQAERTRSIEAIAELRAKLEEARHSQSEARTNAVEVHSVASQDDLEHEARMLRDQLDTERQRASRIAAERENLSGQIETLQRELVEVATGQDEAQQQLAEERRRAAIRELRVTDAEERKNELSARINELQANLASVAERQNEARLHLESERAEASSLRRLLAEAESERDRELQTERAHAAELQQLADTLQSRVDAFHVEVTALKQGKLQLDGLLKTGVGEKSQLSERLQASLGENGRLSGALEAERRRAVELQSQAARSEALLHESEREYFDKVARTESDCADLLAGATEAIDAANSELQVERAAAEAQLGEHAAKVSELETQLEAIRKAAHADKLVMREYADESRMRAERLEKEFEGAIRQRDDLYLRVVDNDRVMRESSENNARLDEQIQRLEARLGEEYARTVRAQAELARSETMIAELTASSESTIARLSARASSLENDVAHQQAVLQHLRETTGSERGRADAAAAELATLTVRYEILQGGLAEMDNLLVAQTEQLLASTSDERDRLLTLIDTVQSSHFWRIKHWLARLRARIFGIALARGA